MTDLTRSDVALALVALSHDEMVGAIIDALNLRDDTEYVGRSGIDSWAGPPVTDPDPRWADDGPMQMYITINLEDAN